MKPDETDTASTPRILILADTDSRWKWGVHTARQLLRGAETHGVLLDNPALPSSRQLAEVGARPASLRVLSLARALDVLAAEFPDVVVLALPGTTVQAVLQAAARLWPHEGPRPIFVAGYVGVVYEKLMDGVLNRAGADLVLANSPADAGRFSAALAAAGADTSAVTETVLPFLTGRPHRPGAERPFTVTFATQPGVPATRDEREYVLRRLVRHAGLHPDRDVLVKLRGRPDEAMTHAEPHPYQVLAARLGVDRPPNLHLVYGGMGEVLSRTDLLVTVSSTAALESMHRGIPTAVITDFGIREHLGNHFFAGSGCLASFDDLDDGATPNADPVWAAAHGLGRLNSAEPARQRLADLLAADLLPPVRPFYSAGNAAEYIRSTLARFDLDHLWEGEDDDPATSPGDLVRYAVRVVARHAYRQGVHRIAPTLRKLARL